MNNRITLVFAVLIVLLCIVASTGFTQKAMHNIGLSRQWSGDPVSAFMNVCVSGNIVPISSLFALYSMCAGSFSIADERKNGSLRMLIFKPLHRRSIIFGKFVGISWLIFLAVVGCITLLTLLVMVQYPLPVDLLPDMAIRLVSIMLNISLMSLTTLAMTMLISVAIRDVAFSLIVSIAAVYVQWFSQILNFLPQIVRYFPSYVIMDATFGDRNNNSIANFALPYDQWLLAALPYILLLVMETIVFLLISMTVFNNEEQ